MAQTDPTYRQATGKPENVIVNKLIERYGYLNITWPLVLIKEQIIAYLYERNLRNTINSDLDVRPSSRSNLPSHFIDYCSSPRRIVPNRAELIPFISSEFSCSYDYITNSTYSTVDLDYVWKTSENDFRGFELTTFWMDFYSKERAEDLVSKINRRPSWKGSKGAHALRMVLAAADDLNIDYYMVCANTVSKVGSDLKTDGNIYLFKLDLDQIDRLEKGYSPLNGVFCTFNEFLDWL